MEAMIGFLKGRYLHKLFKRPNFCMFFSICLGKEGINEAILEFIYLVTLYLLKLDFMNYRISGKILQLDTITQSEAMRRRYRYLSHFPLTTTFQVL